jgi:CRISPR system Cascade subunit CasA
MKFNVATDPWIPVMIGATENLLSLKDVISRSEQISVIAGNTIERFSILRLILCVAQAAIDGPSDEEDWASCRDTIIPASLKYLKKWQDHFELYSDAHPFLQTPTLERVSNREVAFLYPFFSSGNNHTLFDHDARKKDAKGKPAPRQITVEDTVRSLLIKQMMCPGGMTDRSKNGTTWGGVVIKETSYIGAVASNLLLTAIEGDTLLDTIHLNMIDKYWLQEAKIEFGRPVWESHVVQQNDKIARGIVSTYLYNLVPLSRSVLLEDQHKMSLSNGITPVEFPLYRDPMGTMYTRGKGKKVEEAYFKVSPEKAPWRDLQSLLQVSKTTQGVKSPWALRHVVAGTDKDITITTGGMLYKDAKPIAICEWQIHIPAGMLQESALNCYGAQIEKARDAEWSIRYALECYLKLTDKSSKDKENNKVYQSMLSIAISKYWHELEACSVQLINALSEDTEDALEKAQQGWRKDVWNQALDAFKEACGRYEKKNISSYVKALQTLKRGLSRDRRKETDSGSPITA